MNEALIEEISGFLCFADACQWASADHHTLAALAFWIDFDLEDLLETGGRDFWAESIFSLPAIPLPDH
jgi:hypothetical protein